MISSLEILNYRNLVNVNIENIARVNLVIGKNNTGKTNLLESVYYYAALNEAGDTDKLVIDDLAFELLTDDLEIPSNIKFIKSGSAIQGFLNENSFDCFSPEIQEMAVDCLKVVDDRILEIDFLADNLKNPLATLKNGKNVSLLRMGNGVHRVLTILLAIGTSEGGIVLIDELERGLHYAVHEKLSNLIFEMASRQNIQIFASTQSTDVINAFGKIVNKDENKPLSGLLVKLERIDGVIEPLTFDPEELKVIVENNVEVRR